METWSRKHFPSRETHISKENKVWPHTVTCMLVTKRGWWSRQRQFRWKIVECERIVRLVLQVHSFDCGRCRESLLELLWRWPDCEWIPERHHLVRKFLVDQSSNAGLWDFTAGSDFDRWVFATMPSSHVCEELVYCVGFGRGAHFLVHTHSLRSWLVIQAETVCLCSPGVFLTTFRHPKDLNGRFLCPVCFSVHFHVLEKSRFCNDFILCVYFAFEDFGITVPFSRNGPSNDFIRACSEPRIWRCPRNWHPLLGRIRRVQ